MQFVLYQTTNNINGKIYIGVHRQRGEADSYIGSGYQLKQAIQKYGRENFSCQILKTFDTWNEALKAENEIVNEEFVARSDTYNIVVGGQGGFRGNQRSIDTLLNPAVKLKAITNAAVQIKQLLNTDPDFKLKWCEKCRKGGINSPKFKGKKHSPETIERMKSSHAGHSVGKQNSQHGTIWIFHQELKVSKKIPNDQLDQWMLNGWIKGRKMFM